MEIHPAADLFPMMSDEELRALADDIKANGQQEKIKRDPEGRIVDGRNRLAACELAGVEPEYEQVDVSDALSYVVSLNVKRRHLTAGQRACVAAEAWALAEAEGQVQTKGGDRRSKGKSSRLIAAPADHFAKLFGTNGKYVKQARRLLTSRRPLFEQVKLGQVKLADAYERVVWDAKPERERDYNLVLSFDGDGDLSPDEVRSMLFRWIVDNGGGDVVQIGDQGLRIKDVGWLKPSA